MVEVINKVGLAEDLCGLMQRMAKMARVKVKAIIATEGYPEDAYGIYTSGHFIQPEYAVTEEEMVIAVGNYSVQEEPVIVLNIDQMMEDIITTSGKEYLPHAGYNMQDLIIRTLAHELHHASGENDETACTAYGNAFPEKLVKAGICIEPNLKEGYIADMIESYTFDLKNPEGDLNEYELYQKQIIKEGIAGKKENLVIKTLKDLIILKSEDSSESFSSGTEEKPVYNNKPFVKESSKVKEEVTEEEERIIVIDDPTDPGFDPEALLPGNATVYETNEENDSEEEPEEESEEETPERVIIDDPTDPGFNADLLLPEISGSMELEEKVEEVLDSNEEEEDFDKYLGKDNEVLVEGETNDGTMSEKDMLLELIFRTTEAFFKEEDDIRLAHTISRYDKKKEKYIFKPSIGIKIDDLPIVLSYSGISDNGQWKSNIRESVARNTVFPPKEERNFPLANITFNLIDIFPYGGIKIIEQNPETDSKGATLSNEGEWVVQVYRTDTDKCIGMAHTEGDEMRWVSYGN